MDSSGLPDIELSKQLIQLVKDQPFLYDKDLEEFKDEAKKTEAWNIIAESLNLGADETQLRWARLRVDFGRHRRKRQAAEACGSQIRDWPLYGLLTWLAPHVKMRAKRVKRKREKVIKQENYGYKPILPRPNWLVNVDGGVSVEVTPSIVMQNGHEDITESFIVSPDTADYDDEASQENSHQPFERRAFGDGKLSQSEIESFTNKHGLELSLFVEKMKAAFGAQAKTEDFIYTLESGVFHWKRRLKSTLLVSLGRISVKEVPVTETYEDILDRALGELSHLQTQISVLKNENTSLEKERDTALIKVNEFATLKDDWEKKLYGRFVAVLNSKKERIRALEEELEYCIAEQRDDHTGEAGGVSAETEADEEEEDEERADSGEEDPYAGDTQVDSDDGEGPSASLPSSSASTLLGRRHVFESFDSSPGSPSPAPVLPKRAKIPSRTATSLESAGDRVAMPPKNVFKEDVQEKLTEDDDMDPLTIDKNTQDLLDEF